MENLNLGLNFKNYSKLSSKQVSLLFLQAEIKNNTNFNNEDANNNDIFFDVDEFENQIDKEIEEELINEQKQYNKSNIDKIYNLIKENPIMKDVLDINQSHKFAIYYDYYETLSKIDKIETRVLEKFNLINLLCEANEDDRNYFENISNEIKRKIKETSFIIENKFLNLPNEMKELINQDENESNKNITSLPYLNEILKDKSKKLNLLSNSLDLTTKSKYNHKHKSKANHIHNKKSNTVITPIKSNSQISLKPTYPQIPTKEQLNKPKLIPISKSKLSKNTQNLKNNLFNFDFKTEGIKYNNKNFLLELEEKLNEAMVNRGKNKLLKKY